jgi:hypothetical protein
MIVVALQQLRVHRQNPLFRSALPRANRVRDEVTQRVASSWCIRGPIEGTEHPQALYLSPGWEVSFILLRVGWHPVVRFFLEKSLETTWPEFD